MTSTALTGAAYDIDGGQPGKATTWEPGRQTLETTYRFDDAGLLRRLDYPVDILGGGPAVHYPSQYREFDGIMVPTQRQVYVRRPDGTPVLDPVSVAIDVADVTFS